MCTVVVRVEPGAPVRLLALRDEFADRDFDDPGAWWPDRPGVIGGRDRRAGGSWCVSDVASGVSALLVNRIERMDGTPSRGILPLAAVTHGERWTDHVDHRSMASFNLVFARPDGTTIWSWDASELRRTDLDAGTHLITSRGVDADDAKTRRFAPAFRDTPVTGWQAVVDGCLPDDAESALVVRREFDSRRYATVFGQLVTGVAGELTITHSRTPWLGDTWDSESWR